MTAVLAAALTLSACTAARGRVGEPVRAAGSSSGATPATRTAPARDRRAEIHRPCAHNTRPRWVLVSLRAQHLWMCARHRLVAQTPITSGRAGRGAATPTGSYRIQGLNRNSILVPGTGVTYPVKYWIPFDAPLFGFHDAPWQHFPYGSPLYRTRGSDGCVHLPLPAIRFLYRWADIGTPVRIRP